MKRFVIVLAFILALALLPSLAFAEETPVEVPFGAAAVKEGAFVYPRRNAQLCPAGRIPGQS